MIKIIKHEWHQVDSQYVIELDENLLSQIYPENTDEENKQLLQDIESGDVVVQDIIEDAIANDIEIEWNHEYDDWWTDRKGGYEITYDVDSPNNFRESD